MINRTLLFILCVLSLTGCKKLITVDIPDNELPLEDVMGSDALADAAVADIYFALGGYFTSNILGVVNGMTADELSTLNPSHVLYVNNAMRADDALILNTWREFYRVIYRANTIIENLPGARLKADKISQLMGEALFLRAFCYYYLVTNWGDVPLITTTDVNQTAMAPRTPAAEIYAGMLMDLRLAVELLPVAGEKVRANKWAAAALLARVSLQQGNWEEALGNASQVINSGNYFLAAKDSVFLKNSRSAVLQFWMKDGYTFAGQTFIPSNTFSFYPLSTDFINSIEPGDKRKSAWTNTFTYAGSLYNYPYKYKRRIATTGDSAEYVMVLRLEEQYLISAEAKCQLNNIDWAIEDLNIIRSHAGLPPLGSLNKADCLLAIEKERRIEMFSEWGDRWLSLKRTGRISTIKNDWKPSAALYPIPQQERNRDPNLTQNEGYN